MKFSKKKYKARLADTQIENYLKIFSAISIEGPKWCGKPWAANNKAKSAVYLDDESTYELALTDLNLMFTNEYPELIDEWNIIPKIWDKVRRLCDQTNKKGRYILTCSTTLNDDRRHCLYFGYV